MFLIDAHPYHRKKLSRASGAGNCMKYWSSLWNGYIHPTSFRNGANVRLRNCFLLSFFASGTSSRQFRNPHNSYSSGANAARSVSIATAVETRRSFSATAN